MWFTIEEARLLDDTLWYTHHLRREYAAFRGMLHNREVALDTAKAYIARLEAAYSGLQEAVPVLRATNTRLEGELSACRATRGRFWAGFGVGAGVLVAALGVVALGR